MAARLGPAAGARVAVTGGAGGIGRALVAALLGEGCGVAVLDLPAVLAAHPPAGGALPLPCDATDEAGVGAAFASLRDRWGGLDGLVTLAGFAGPKLAAGETSLALWTEVTEGNLAATFLACRAALPLLRAGKDPAVVTMASGLAAKPAPGYAPYAAAKAGVLALTRALAAENAPWLRVNAVAPSAVETAFLRGGTHAGGADAPRFDTDAYSRSVPLGRLATPEDVVGPILFLLGPAAAYVTGQTLHVNGGLLMP
ncbi:SDR family NAD(P)-dependent oxidoreductase [Roseomonas sp. AR75]|uniref:SDR family NAD(P)-dependent oxidoreductase n=1 Tax=Roseomonas sp. AR75 TaxID=2562311 RepID=UPI0010C135E6|nr:SDR family oxidoreductase [Roseomonas sp. AR75]